ncbi:hypothetical protein I3843_04G133400 [Carya illinoinensis]|nr:probable glucan endo-1,3-beta-glucosidase BG4 [Carya illinoinensis]KAG2712788.1 hypothetical protein I3760_04G142300 [Carya illinoinensis]KAG6718291.1 hypothetical protein I3842_04G142600 [Carya illinoinensis]KAG7983975.1 hypothetical protein I3843_04G133400 [Carya illinoinensis]
MALALLIYWFALILAGIATIPDQLGLAEAAFYNLGVIYGLSGTNIPDPYSTIDLCENIGIRKIRLLEHNDYVMLALNNTGHFEVSIGVRNDELPEVASSVQAAESWYELRVKPYHHGVIFDYIVVGNDAIPGPYSAYLAPALENMMEAISVWEAGTSTKVTTVVSDSVLNPRFPPSVAAFKPEIKLYMEKVLKAIRKSRPVQSRLMVNVFPYYDYAAGIIPKDFAVFGRDKPYFWDSNLGYWNMFDALVDAFYWAISGVGVDGVFVEVAATGWPSAGNDKFTTSAIAAEYNQNLMEHIVNGNGTPYAPWFIEGFLYSLYNEDKKPVGPAQHFGLFNPDQTPAYPFSVPRDPPTPEAERVIKG